MYEPDNWVVLKFPDHYRILAGWSGGYSRGSSWRLNSGITRVVEEPDHYLFYGSSGSCYKCHKDSYCVRTNNAYVYADIKQRYGDKVDLMPEDTDWRNIDWGLQ